MCASTKVARVLQSQYSSDIIINTYSNDTYENYGAACPRDDDTIGGRLDDAVSKTVEIGE